jgi:hypothetical protein
MRKSISLLTNLLTSSTLFWGVPTVEGQEVNLRIPAETTSYCDMKLPLVSENLLFLGNPVLNESTGNSVDFSSSCDHDPLGRDGMRVHRELPIRGYFAHGD